jgi:8-oxo-dGTP pyrophosphatase MutT (NUDIX family)
MLKKRSKYLVESRISFMVNQFGADVDGGKFSFKTRIKKLSLLQLHLSELFPQITLYRSVMMNATFPYLSVDQRWYTRPPGCGDRITAGGVVFRLDANERVLVALTREHEVPHYVLPKGGVEITDADLEAAARREVLEEVGLSELETVCYLGERGRLCLHRRNWQIQHYYLFTTTQESGTPTDPNPLGLFWFPVLELPQLFWPEQRELILEGLGRSPLH